MRILWVYDREGWAIQALGKMLQPYVSAAGGELHLCSMLEAKRATELLKPNIVHLGYSTIFNQPHEWLGPWGLTTTVHDPIEISPFTNTLSWKERPFFRRDFSLFEAVSTTSEELFVLLKDHYEVGNLILTPTSPLPLSSFKRRHFTPYGSTKQVRIKVLSSTISYSRISFLGIGRRLVSRSSLKFFVDSRGAFNLGLARGLLVRTGRKNVPLLLRVRDHYAGDPRIQFDLRTSSRDLDSRDAYFAWMNEGDLYLCLSNMEGGPLPVMEATYAGLAIITTQVGQVESWVRNGSNGMLVSNFQETISAIDAYLQFPDKLTRHQRSSQDLAATKIFDPSPWLKLWSV